MAAGEIELNWTTVARLAELAYRCNLCRRCAQTCPIGVDNGLIAHEIRKLFSQEMGIVAKELHDDGSVLQLKVGSSTGMNPVVVKDNIEFIDEDVSEKTGIKIETPWDKDGADILLIHNAGEIMAWPVNPGAFAVIFEAAGLSWTMSSEIARLRQHQLRRLVRRRPVRPRCHQARRGGEEARSEEDRPRRMRTRAQGADRHRRPRADRRSQHPPRELHGHVRQSHQRQDASRSTRRATTFPVTLHDPCNLVRLMGIVEPQRRVLQKIAPRFREMTPHGVENYCCGGGSGFAIMSGHNFGDWRAQIAGRKKLEQILNAFKDELDPSIKKYLCAPCSNCKGQLRDIIGLLRPLGEVQHPLRRSCRAHRQLHDRREARIHRVGVALDAGRRLPEAKTGTITTNSIEKGRTKNESF